MKFDPLWKSNGRSKYLEHCYKRNEKINTMYEKGITMKEIARVIGISSARVQQIIAGFKNGKYQMSEEGKAVLRANAKIGLCEAIRIELGVDLGHGENAIIPKELAAKVSYSTLIGRPNMGKASIAAINEWLAEDGLELRDMPVRTDTIQQAIKMLESKGYIVSKKEV